MIERSAVSDDPAGRCAALVGRRHFVDREHGVLMVWMPGDDATRRELGDLVPLVQQRYPAARFSLREAGSAVAVTARGGEADLAEIEAAYLR
jgi:hypothetical protein